MKRLLKNLKENLIENCSIRLNVSHKVNHLACTIPFFKEWKLSFYLTDRTVEKRQECNSQGQWVRIKPTSTPLVYMGQQRHQLLDLTSHCYFNFIANISQISITGLHLAWFV